MYKVKFPIIIRCEKVELLYLVSLLPLNTTIDNYVFLSMPVPVINLLIFALFFLLEFCCSVDNAELALQYQVLPININRPTITVVVIALVFYLGPKLNY